jgi:tRNA pseudouridine55 synthase
MDGILLIDKPLDWTSADVVRKIKNLTRAKKVGHAGTLDPRATGLLVLLLGSATKRSNEFLNGIKEYEGQVTLGFTSDSGDSDGKLTAKNGLRDYSLAEVEQALQSFFGESNKVTPM